MLLWYKLQVSWVIIGNINEGPNPRRALVSDMVYSWQPNVTEFALQSNLALWTPGYYGQPGNADSS